MIRQWSGAEISHMGVVKAGAYGHGALPVARILQEEGIAALAVATPEEGLELRKGGIQIPIFLLAGPYGAPGDLLVRHGLTPILYNEAQCDHLEQTLNQPLDFHLKVDSGMTRLGVRPENLGAFLEKLKKYPQLNLKGLLTHLAQADESFEGATAQQYEVFQKAVDQTRKSYGDLPCWHIANSAAILGQRLGGYNWARPGIILYGSNPNPRFTAGQELKPVMTLESQIISLKTVPKGTAVSYGGEWVAPRSSQIAVVPIGYADGYLRHLGNRAEVLVEKQRAPVVGRVCMDLIMIDVTDLPQARLGQAVRLWGPGLPVEEVATWGETISYELLCQVSGRVPRIYEGE